MIISHRNKFIFIKTTKTAGTSIEVELNKILGPEDVATPIFPPVDGHSPQNFIVDEGGVSEFKFYNHIAASDVKKQLGAKIFRDYFVFCVEREPVDKCISHFSMLRNSPHHNEKTKHLTIDEYVEQRSFPIDVTKYTDENGNLIVDRILHYENLAEELREVGSKLGFEVNLCARAKSGFREQVAMNAQQVALIYTAFESSNRFTGYHR